MSAVIHVRPSASRGAAQAATTAAKAVSAVTATSRRRSRRASERETWTASVGSTRRGSGLHQSTGSPSSNHGKIPRR